VGQFYSGQGSMSDRSLNLPTELDEKVSLVAKSSLDCLSSDSRVKILHMTDDKAVRMFRRVSRRCKCDAEMATALAQQESVQFVSAHAMELVPLLKTVDIVYGGWVSVKLCLITLQGGESACALFFDSELVS
jgi:hypothetical protein